MSQRFGIRLKTHLLITAAAAASLFLLVKLIPGDDRKYLWSMATGYVSIILLAVTLLIGPFNVYKRRNNPVSSDLRRDIGIWCGIIGLAHVVVGIQVHMGNIWLYFFKSVDGDNAFTLRSDLFGAANYIGLAGAVLLAILLFLSNDISLQWLKPQRWKMLQRWNYFFFVAVLIHGIMYQVIEKRALPIIIFFSVIMGLTVAGQLVGISIRKNAK